MVLKAHTQWRIHFIEQIGFAMTCRVPSSTFCEPLKNLEAEMTMLFRAKMAKQNVIL